ncbi:hypothetical protein OAL14_07285 [Gammaproteobacteria bacterium]|nr:hypothetical protein [Gammaproteobacteria bacterium]
MSVTIGQIMCFFGLVFASSLGSGETSVPNTFKTGEPAKADQVNDNFSSLASAVDANSTAITAVSNPGGSYSVLSTATLESGLVRTILYAYELSDFSGYNRYADYNPSLFLGEGTEYIVNALGKFRGEWSYIADYSKTYSDPDDADNSPVACPDGSAMPRFDVGDVVYNLTWRNERGAFAFSNRGTVNAGIYFPQGDCSNFTDDSGVARDMVEYYYLEGKGVGIYSCVERAAYHGGFLMGEKTFWDKTYVPSRTSYPNALVGVFDRSNNGSWGTYYLEIDAPADCLKLN